MMANRHVSGCLFLLLTILASGRWPIFVALAGPAPAVRVFIVGATAAACPAPEAPQARIGQTVTLYVVVQRKQGAAVLYYTDAPRLCLGARPVVAQRMRPLSALGSVAVAWWQVEPHPYHVRLPPPNAGNPAYSNCELFGPRHGRWLGLDTLEYFETPVTDAATGRLAVYGVRPTYPRLQGHGPAGTMRYKAAVTWAGTQWASPGGQALGRHGILPSVFRLSFRESDDFVGYLTTYFNVPNVFGSTGGGLHHQTEQYQGADCADVIVGGARRAGATLPYLSASGLQRVAPPVHGRLTLTATGLFEADGPDAGRPAHLLFGRDVRRGDLMLIDYKDFADSPRSWDHIAVIVEDAGIAGQFDEADLAMDMGYLYGLVRTPIARHGPATIRILRFSPSVRRDFDRWQRRLAALAAKPSPP